MLTYISPGESTDDRVDDGVGQHVRIGMTQKTLVMQDFHAPEDKATAYNEAMGIISEADTVHLFFLPRRLMASAARAAAACGASR
jgi:hypothetical protein